jgi:hypothetical protein
MFRKSNKPVKMYRRLRFESLQNRVLLDATPIQVGLDYNSEIFSTNFYRQELDTDFQNDVLVPANVMAAGMPNEANGTEITVGVTVGVTTGSSGGTQWTIGGGVTFGSGGTQGTFGGSGTLGSGGTQWTIGGGVTFGSGGMQGTFGGSGTFGLPSSGSSLPSTFGLPSGGSGSSGPAPWELW